MEQQYIQLLKDIKEKGVLKPAARENMPGTLSLFGYQMRHDLSKGFPLITTKKMPFKGVVAELLWFLRGDTNIKFLDDLGIRYMWHEDAYNYYLKVCKKYHTSNPMTYEDFCESIKNNTLEKLKEAGRSNDGVINTILPNKAANYTLGDCGKQYGWLWRTWEGQPKMLPGNEVDKWTSIDQLKELINGLKSNPMGRRHIITAWNPATLDDMALNACHAFVQFNCRPISMKQRFEIWNKGLSLGIKQYAAPFERANNEKRLDEANVPKYYIDCQLYQRSADVVLGVPFNIASYALLTEILAKLCNMIPGEFIHTFGDVHIYENHLEAVDEQLQREPRELPKLIFKDEFNYLCDNTNRKDVTLEEQVKWLLESIPQWSLDLFKLENYNPHPKLESETKLSTGLK